MKAAVHPNSGFFAQVHGHIMSSFCRKTQIMGIFCIFFRKMLGFDKILFMAVILC